MRRTILNAMLTISLVFLAATPSYSATTHSEQGAKDKRAELREGMRKLWEDHITWTRLYIVSAAAALPDLEVTTQRLLRNQVDIGDAIKPFYGTEAGNKLTVLLKEHITGAANLVTAAKAGDAAKVAAAKTAWYANADEISAFLHGANPKYWPLEDLKSMMHQHLDLTLAEATNRLKGQYAQDVADYDRVHDEILLMSDMLSTGIIKQFPDKL